jgi:hypothetical protein
MAKNPGIHIKQWHSGLRTNRAATSTPIRPTLGGAIPLNDTLWDGLNMEITPANTLARRPGWVKYCTATYGTDVPKGFAGTVLNGTLFRLLDTDKKIYSFDGTSLTSIFTKGTTTQSFFKQVGNLLFFSDGTENMKWKGPSDTNTGALAAPTNNGIVAPTAAPTLSNLNWYDSAGHSQTVHAWIPGYTYTNTSGAARNYFFLAPTGEIQWAVIANGASLTSAKAAPNWAANYGVFGARTIDGQMEWTNCGPIGTWAAGTAFANAGYVATHPLSATSTTATITADTTVTNFAWQITTGPQNPSGTAAGFANSAGLTGNTNILKIQGLGFAIPAGATVTGIEADIYRVANRLGVSDVLVKLLKAGTPVGSNKALSGNWPTFSYPLLAFGLPDPHQYLVPSGSAPAAGVEKVYGSSSDLWGTTWTPTDINDSTFGIEIQANQSSTATTTAGITYVQGNPLTPITFTVYFIAGASDISGTVYAKVIVDSNNNLQRVKTAGTSGGSAPTWSSTIGGTTTDGGITWECLGTANQLPVLFNWSYAYSYHSTDGVSHTSTCSPLLTINGPIIGTGVALNGVGSSDTQCDRADLYRTSDGGSLLLYDSSTTNTSGAISWTDAATDQDLNFEVIGPVAHANDPPPSGMTMLEYHMGRLWGVVGSSLFFSAGPDCINGDGNQAWPPANEFQFDSAITGLTATSLGLVVETADGMHIVLGGPQTQTFWVRDLNSDRGVLTQNCLAQDGDRLVMYTSNRQLFMMDPSDENEIGFPVAPTLASTFDPNTMSLVTHRSGQDQGIFLSDGATTTMRYNLSAQSWDVLATPVGGIGPLASIQTALGTKTLLSTSNGYIVARSPSTFQDSGNSYSGFATVGSLTISEAGQDPGKVQSVLVTSAAVGSALTVSVLPNEISGSFTALGTAVADPYQLPASSTLSMKRYDWNTVATPLANALRHLQVKITLPTEAAKNEVYTLGLV